MRQHAGKRKDCVTDTEFAILRISLCHDEMDSSSMTSPLQSATVIAVGFQHHSEGFIMQNATIAIDLAKNDFRSRNF